MRKYWWVNHKQTVRQEIEGSYLWSPKCEVTGARSQFYDNMRNAAPGDLVLSFANGKISFVGYVADFALSSPKPLEFGSIGYNWAMEGWLLPVVWKPLSAPVHPKGLISEIAPLLPAKYSPIHRETGNGNQKAYLAAINGPLFSVVLRHAGMEGEALIWELAAQSRAIAPELAEQIDHAISQEIENDGSLAATEKEQLLKARRGQGVFRENVGRVETRCRLTGVKNPRLLIASHIKPWRVCNTSQERLDGCNGLFLTPDADLLFDRGFITFTDEGDVIASSKLDPDDVLQLGLADAIGRNAGPFLAAQRQYLAYHRLAVFIF